MHKRSPCRHAVCLSVCLFVCLSVRQSVCLSVTFVYSVGRNEHYLHKKIHHPVAMHTSLVFPLLRYGTISLRALKAGAGKIAILCQWLHRVLSTVRPPSVIHTAAPDRGKLVTLIAAKYVIVSKGFDFSVVKIT